MWNEQQLILKVQRLSPRLRTAFAAACASHSLHMYVDWSNKIKWGNAKRMKKALDLVWRFVEGESIAPGILSEEAEIVYSLVPDSEDFPSGSSSGALDAGSAVVYAIDCAAEGLTDHAINAAKASFVAFDIVCHNDSSSDPDILEKEWIWQNKILENLSRWEERPISRNALT